MKRRSAPLHGSTSGSQPPGRAATSATARKDTAANPTVAPPRSTADPRTTRAGPPETNPGQGATRRARRGRATTRDHDTHTRQTRLHGRARPGDGDRPPQTEAPKNGARSQHRVPEVSTDEATLRAPSWLNQRQSAAREGRAERHPRGKDTAANPTVAPPRSTADQVTTQAGPPETNPHQGATRRARRGRATTRDHNTHRQPNVTTDGHGQEAGRPHNPGAANQQTKKRAPTTAARTPDRDRPPQTEAPKNGARSQHRMPEVSTDEATLRAPSWLNQRHPRTTTGRPDT